ncbi:MAG: hypothetical protein C7B43_16225 [Sulfobacillus benefaciens]|uniref:Uncharacterized protein n=1 Tax=Sulfobacillus benefaciens TaxID=453960 RepID=A0A2T2WU30_9FIRM|nr:MAG: hypothetical protein C7B43_16225 [Sulfobacillus benefaciens]
MADVTYHVCQPRKNSHHVIAKASHEMGANLHPVANLQRVAGEKPLRFDGFWGGALSAPGDS